MAQDLQSCKEDIDHLNKVVDGLMDVIAVNQKKIKALQDKTEYLTS